ncbi:glycosyltransferase [Candidatus Bathyarchaeota archaeon]|nr:glycosyltransferase [Candidatus Bathyarchaeota archaeon]
MWRDSDPVGLSVAVVHPYLNRGGGAERVCLGVIKALVSGGFRVSLYTLDRVDWRFLEERLGSLTRPHEEAWLFERLPIRGEHSLEFYTSALFPCLLLNLRAEAAHDLILNTYGDLGALADISYINAVPARLYHLYPALNPVYKRIASRLYDLNLKGLERLFGRGLILTNSKFMHILLRKWVGCGSLVVYPPVDIDRFRQESMEDREDLVVTVSRLRRGKHLELVPKVAKMVGGGEFVIFGLADQASKGSMAALRRTIGDMGLEGRVRLLVNQPLEKIRATLSKAKVYLHTQPLEAFGISVVEAMASGCVPVVPRLGGPWSDILEMRMGFYGFCYSSPEEASKRIKGILEDEGMWREISFRARSRSRDFTPSRFESRIRRIVKGLYEGRI